jgi:mannosyltransferase
MEAAGALGRAGLSTYLEAAREFVRSRSRAFWIVAGLTVAGAVLRFATLGLQSYHHDEIVTASRVLREDFWHAMDAVGFSESAPPLYYALAWLWTQATGTDEVGLRSFSALAGVATVPVAYLLGAELSSRRSGILAAALVAFNPMALWYSQEGRGYALLILLTAISLLCFVRTLERGRRRDSVAWGVASALAMATHYFAFFVIAPQALWLLSRRRGVAIRGVAIAAVGGLLLAPLAILQASHKHAEWISGTTLGHRLWETGVTFMLGETGDIIASPERPLRAVVPCLLAVVALLLVWRRGDDRERRGTGILLVIAAAAVTVPVVVGLLDPSKDYVLARNLIPALVPLLVAVAIGLTLRKARRLGNVLAAALVVFSLGFSVWASFAPALQRPDWDPVAAELGEPTTPRAMVSWTLGAASLRYYLSTGSFQVQPSDGFRWWVGEIDFISDGPAPPPPRHIFGPGFRQVEYKRVGRLYIRRYETPGPELRHLQLRTVGDVALGFRTNRVLLDGIGP